MPASFSKHIKSPLVWEREWQMELDAIYSKPSFALLQAAGLKNETFVAVNSSPLMSEAGILNLRERHRDLCILQRDTLTFAAEKFTVDNFEDKWRTAGPKVREKYYFEAMKRVCDIADMEEQRLFAPEISLSRFQERNGQGYIDLLKSLLPAKQTPNQYVRIDHPAVDAYLGIQTPFDTVEVVPTDGRHLLRQFMDTSRCLFMSLMVWHTLLSFYDIIEEGINVRSERKSDFKRNFSRAAQQWELSEKDIDVIVREHKQVQKQGVWMCANCRKPESQLSTEGRLKACGKCSVIQRNVRYCSRDCQINDWNHGNPPHKTICGSKLASNLLTSPQSASHTTASVPTGTYSRSMALVHQMSMLKKHPEVDYFLIFPAPQPDICMMMANHDLSILFRVKRDLAFETGDPEAIGFIYKVLQGMVRSGTDFGLEQLEKQLAAEFQMDVKDIQGKDFSPLKTNFK